MAFITGIKSPGDLHLFRDVTAEKVQRNLQEYMQAGETDRRDEIEKQYRMYIGFTDALGAITSSLNRRDISEEYAYFPAHIKERQEEYDLRVKRFIHVNLVRQVVSKLRRLYKKPWTRKLVPEDENATDSADVAEMNGRLNMMLNENQFHAFSLTNATEFILTGTSFVQPFWNPERKQVVYRHVLMDHSYPIVDPMNVRSLLAFIEVQNYVDNSVGREQVRRVTRIFTRNEQLYLGDNDAPIEGSYYEHNLGEVPIVTFRADEIAGDHFGLSPVRDLVGITQEVNYRKSLEGVLAADQTFSVASIRDPQAQMKDSDIELGPKRALRTPEGLTFETPNPRIQELLEGKKDLIQDGLDAIGIPIVSIRGGTVASGFSLVVQMLPLVEAIQEIAIFAQSAEKQLHELAMKIANANMRGSFPDSGWRLDVEPPEQFLPQDREAAVRVDQMLLDQGRVTREDLVKRDHPDWSDEQVAEHMAKVAADRAQRRPQIAGIGGRLAGLVEQEVGAETGGNGAEP